MSCQTFKEIDLQKWNLLHTGHLQLYLNHFRPQDASDGNRREHRSHGVVGRQVCAALEFELPGHPAQHVLAATVESVLQAIESGYVRVTPKPA